MPDIPESPPAVPNQLLGRFSPADRRSLASELEPVTLSLDQVIYERHRAIEHAYFPTGAVLSALLEMENGDLIEVATIGREGLVGDVESFGVASPHKLIARIPGPALRIGLGGLLAAKQRSEPVRALLIAYQAAFMAQVSQSVGCNGLHRLEQRCSRWLLMSRDRAGTDQIRLTHEYLAIMLGARRASVTDALRPLQDAGLVRSERGRISILDGSGLEARSCECYRVVRDEYQRLLGRPARRAKNPPSEAQIRNQSDGPG